ncbi:MAG: hypothetical protein HRK26_04190 [Rickettsiaceae bacterium H1]|nr:hypothetical protein [Rickettsiaceae bacterium H1]
MKKFILESVGALIISVPLSYCIFIAHTVRTNMRLTSKLITIWGSIAAACSIFATLVCTHAVCHKQTENDDRENSRLVFATLCTAIFFCTSLYCCLITHELRIGQILSISTIVCGAILSACIIPPTSLCGIGAVKEIKKECEERFGSD